MNDIGNGQPFRRFRGGKRGIDLKRPARNYMANTILLLSSLLFAGLASEGVARWFYPEWGPRTAGITLFWQYDPLLGWSHVPGSEGEFNSADFDSWVTINSKGHRDLERTYERIPGRSRVLVLGDSMVWGYGVQDDETFTRIMETENPGLEVINLGVSGYGTDQEFLLLENEGSHYQPDLVVVFVTQNDFLTNVLSKVFIVYEKPMFVLDNDGELLLTNSPVPRPGIPTRLMAWLARTSYVLNRAGQVYNGFTASKSEPWPPAAESEIWEAPFPRTRNEVLTVALLRQIRHTSQSFGAKVVFVLVDGLGKTGVEMQQFFSEEVPLLNLAPVFAAEEYWTLHVDSGGHWNALGHARVAERLAEYLESDEVAGGAGVGESRTPGTPEDASRQ